MDQTSQVQSVDNGSVTVVSTSVISLTDLEQAVVDAQAGVDAQTKAASDAQDNLTTAQAVLSKASQLLSDAQAKSV